MFAGGTVWWIDFLSSNLCHDAGGSIENGECVGAVTTIPYLWEAPWQRIALTLVPPGVVAVITVAVVWAMGREKEKL